MNSAISCLRCNCAYPGYLLLLLFKSGSQILKLAGLKAGLWNNPFFPFYLTDNQKARPVADQFFLLSPYGHGINNMTTKQIGIIGIILGLALIIGTL